MTNTELAEMLTKNGDIAIPYFDGQLLQVEREEATVEQALPVLKNFLTLSAENRRSDARHLIAYCRLMDRAVHGGVLDSVGGAIPTDDTIWNHVRISYLSLTSKSFGAEEKLYIMAIGSVDWEREHGVLMSWENGERLVKVSQRDNSPTNYYPSGKEPDPKHVFHCYDPALCTLRDDA